MRKFVKMVRIGLMAFVLANVFAPNVSMAQWTGETWDPKNILTTPASTNTASDLSNTTTTSTTDNVKAGSSGEASGDIFTILQKKLYDTLVDLRKIVYVIAGFGLVVFSVAAIFNKISYKHLGYIMIGLSLLSLMFPFLEYFSGYDADAMLAADMQKQMAFQNYLDASDYERIRGELNSDVLNGNGEGQEALSDEELARRREEMEKNALQPIDSSGLTGGVTGGNTGGLIGLEQRNAIINAGCDPRLMKGAWSAEKGSRTICTVGSDGTVQTTQEVCRGTIKNGSCNKTFGQILGDTWGTVTDAIQVGLNAGQAFSNTMGAILDSGAAVGSIKAIMDSDAGFLDKMYYIGNMAANTWGNNGAVTRDLYGIVGGLQGMTQGAGNTATRWSTDYNDNPTGSNPFSDLMGALSGYGDTANHAISGTTTHVNNAARGTSEAHTQANNVNAIIARFQGMNGSFADRWKALFGGN